MTVQEEMELFTGLRLAAGGKLDAWLAAKEAEAVKVMALGDGAQMHRAQGRYGFIDEMKKLLDASKKAR